MLPEHHHQDHSYDTDDSETFETGALPAHRIPIHDPEEWSNYWSEELVILYHIATDHAAQYGWSILDTGTFAKFVEYAYENSSKCPPPC